MRTPTLAAALVCIVLAACDKDAPPPEIPPQGPSAPSIQVGASDQNGATEEDEAAQKRAELLRNLEARWQEIEAEYAKKREAWTDQRKQSAARLVGKSWKTLKPALKEVLASPHREEPERDKDRHPAETLGLFGLRPDMTVLELGPGEGWYTEILAPILARNGKLVHLGFAADAEDPMIAFAGRVHRALLDSKPELFGKIVTISNASRENPNLGEPDSHDMVIVMRMMHNYHRNKTLDRDLDNIFRVLKPGGILAVEQHRAADDADPDQAAPKGYLPEKWLIETIERHGFSLDKKSEINANPKDTKDYEQGVWVLPPTFALGDKDKAKYEAIGESDRMTLKFIKPKK